MKTYRAKRKRHGIAVLQRRRLLIFWQTLAFGTYFQMTTAALRLERTKERRNTSARQPQPPTPATY